MMLCNVEQIMHVLCLLCLHTYSGMSERRVRAATPGLPGCVCGVVHVHCMCCKRAKMCICNALMFSAMYANYACAQFALFAYVFLRA